MKFFPGIIMGLVLIASAACSSMGGVYLADEQVAVSVGQKVSDDPKKIKKLQEEQTVETLHRYITHRFKKLNVRKSLKFEVAITTYRIGWGRDHMGVHVIVKENDEILQEFDEVETTGRRSVTEKLSKGLARRIYERIKDL